MSIRRCHGSRPSVSRQIVYFDVDLDHTADGFLQRDIRDGNARHLVWLRWQC